MKSVVFVLEFNFAALKISDRESQPVVFKVFDMSLSRPGKVAEKPATSRAALAKQRQEAVARQRQEAATRAAYNTALEIARREASGKPLDYIHVTSDYGPRQLKKTVRVQLGGHADKKPSTANTKAADRQGRADKKPPQGKKDQAKAANGRGVKTVTKTVLVDDFHEGTDFRARINTRVYATGEGTVVYKGFTSANGNKVEIDHGNGAYTTYIHLNNYAAGLRVGSRVQARQLIAFSGKTGTGVPHLDYRIKVYLKGRKSQPTWVDPEQVMGRGSQTAKADNKPAPRKAAAGPAKKSVS